MLILKEIKKVAKDYLFPIFCLGCGVEGCWVCESCKNRFEVVDSTEFFDKKMSNIKVLFSALQYYEESLLGKAFKIFKYEFSEEVFCLFESIILKYFEIRLEYFKNIDFIIPVPLHPRKYAERGFNQSEMIAQVVGKILNKAVLNDAIYRIRYTKNQARLNKSEREDNIKNAFELNKKYYFSNKVVLLIDDVYTTGATIHECSQLFENKKVKGIYAFTLFRGR